MPDSLLACQEAPEVPSRKATARDVGAYVVDLHEAHGDCHDKLGAVRGLVKGAETHGE